MKTEFIRAYVWLYGTTKASATKVYKSADQGYIKAVVDAFKNNSCKAFRED